MNKLQSHQEIVQDVVEQLPTKIFFSSQVFGMPTKNRTLDPSMFDLLSWNNEGIEAGSFKKKEYFKKTEQAYLNMISRQPWMSQTQQSYVNYLQNSIQVNQNVFSQIQNYVQNHQSGKDKAVHTKTNKISQGNNKQHVPIKQAQNVRKKNQSQENIAQRQHDSKNKQKDSKVSDKKYLTRPSSAININKMNSPKNQIYTPSGLFATDPQEKKTLTSQKRAQITQEEQAKLIQKFKQTTRWIPNSSFTTYFGRPPFQNYGRGNTKPVDGGLVYGTYLYSHNVHPHRGANSPSNVQTYPVALMKAKSQGNLIPTQPKTLCNFLQNKLNNQKQKQYDNFGSISAAKNVYGNFEIQVPDLSAVQKFGGKKKTTSRN